MRNRRSSPPLIPGSIIAQSEGSTTDVSLLLRLNHDPSDQAAWGQFVDRYGAIYTWCRDWRLQEADARDVTQMVLAKLAVQLYRFTYDPSQTFRGWLRTLAMNAYRDWMADRGGTQAASARARRRRGPAPDRGGPRRPGASPGGGVRPRIARRGRAAGAAAGRAHTWEAYRLTAIEGLSGAEAAARLGVKVAAVFVSKSHVLRSLRDEVQTLENQAQAYPPLMSRLPSPHAVHALGRRPGGSEA